MRLNPERPRWLAAKVAEHGAIGAAAGTRACALRSLSWLAGVLMIAGCATLPAGSPPHVGPGPAASATVGPVTPGLRDVRGSKGSGAAETFGTEDPRIDSVKLAAEGIKYLQGGDVERGLKLFNAAIKFAPTVPEFHLLAGLAYHLQFLSGGSDDARESAEIGYQLAARYGPREPMPWVQTGRLHSDAGQHVKSSAAYARAVELRPGQPDALYGLATSSYLAGDIKTALWSADALAGQGWNPMAVNRLRAMIFSAIGQPEEAARYRDAYKAGTPRDAAELAAFDKRLQEVGSLLPNQRWLQPPADASALGPTTPLKPVVFKSETEGTVRLAQAGIGAGMPSAGSAFAPALPLASPPASGPRRPWFQCQVATPFGMPQPIGMPSAPMMFGGAPGGQGGGEETSPLAALPSPCEGDGPPRTVMIDAVLLRTEDQVSRSYGVNLLQGLTGFFGMLANRPVATFGAEQPLQRSSFFGVGGAGSSGGSAAALGYSLNIANATVNRNEVLARPTLMAIDRMPSTFFSGSTVSIAVGGGVAGNGQLVDKQIGTSFSITPTFIDDETLLLAVKAVRSFVEPPAAGTTGVNLSTSRNSVNANLVVKYGQTVVISGLTERQLIRGDAGVPVLQDIPGIQYLFSTKANADFFRTVVVLITPRRSVSSDADVAAVAAEKKRREEAGVPQSKQYAFYWRIDEYAKTLQKYAPNLDSAIDTLDTNVLFKNFKGTDLTDTNWSTMSRLKVLLHDIQGLIFH